MHYYATRLSIIISLLLSSYCMGQDFIKAFNGILEMAPVDGGAYFVANDGSNGYELYYTDGLKTGTTLVKDIFPGTESSKPEHLFAFNGDIYFSADDGIHGRELWRSDGTAEGTFLVKNIHEAHRQSANPFGFTIYNNELYFIAKDYYLNSGYTLWKTDGTEAGTIKITEYESGEISKLQVANNKLYFLKGRSLFETDGTSTGTQLIPVNDNSVSELNTFNGQLYFITHTTYRQTIWLYTINALNELILLQQVDQPQYGDQDIHNFTEYNGQVYFSITTDDTVDTDVLWKTDGTMEGTIPIKSFSWTRHFSDSNIKNFVVYKNELYFNAGSSNGFALWKSDGTASGTVPATSFSIGNHDRFIVHDDLLFYTSSNRLWQSDGTEEGTRKFSELEIVSRSSGDGFNMGKIADQLMLFEGRDMATTGLYSTSSKPFMQVRGNYSPFYASEDVINIETKIDSLVKRNITILNSGNEDLVISKVFVSGEGFYLNGNLAQNSSTTNPEGHFSHTLKPLDQSKFEIQFYPSSAGFYDAYLTILSNDAANPEFRINLKGYVYDEVGTTDLTELSFKKVLNFNKELSSIRLSNDSIEENLPIGTTVGNFSETTTTNATFSLSEGEGDMDNGLFYIEGRSLKSQISFDYECRSTYTIRVKATNAEGSSNENVVLVNILDQTESIISEDCREELFNMNFGFLDVEFLDDQNVVAIGSHGLISKSNDGGLNWSVISHQKFTHLFELQFVNDTGYIMGYNQMLKSVDAGESWFEVSLPDTVYPYPAKLYFLTETIGFVFGDDGKIFKTLDGGKNWRQKPRFSYSRLNSAHFLDEKNGFIVGSGKTLLQTNDAGESWDAIPMNFAELGFNVSFTNIYFYTDMIGYITSNKGDILKTIDGGSNWYVASELEYTISINDIVFITEDDGYVITENYIYSTQNGGLSWIRNQDAPFQDKRKISVSNDLSHLVIVGPGGSGWLEKMGSSILHKGASGEWESVSHFKSGIEFLDVIFSGNLGFVFNADGGTMTKDGGLTWQNFDGPEETINAVKLHQDQLYALTRNYIYRSSDYGKTWEWFADSDYSTELVFFDSDVIYAFPLSSGMQKSADGGQTWTHIDTGLWYISEVYFKNKNEGFVLDFDHGRRTQDGGQTWTDLNIDFRIDDFTQYSGSSIEFYDNSIGIIGSGGGILYKTKDGGDTWQRIKTVISNTINYLHAVSELEWYAVTGSGIYKSVDGGLNWFKITESLGDAETVYIDNDVLYTVDRNNNFYKLTPKGSTPTRPGYINGNEYVTTGAKEIYQLNDNSNEVTWSVEGDHRMVYNQNQASIQWDMPGTYKITVTSTNSCGTGDSSILSVVVEDPIDTKIIGDQTVSKFSNGIPYFTEYNNASRYEWFVTGQESYEHDKNEIMVNWGDVGAGTITVVETDNLSGARFIDSITIEIGSTLSIEPSEKEETTLLYPNPASSYIRFKTDQFNIIESLKIIDISGRQVMNLRQYENEKIDVSHLKSGTYIVSIKSRQGVINKKLIKQ